MRDNPGCFYQPLERRSRMGFQYPYNFKLIIPDPSKRDYEFTAKPLSVAKHPRSIAQGAGDRVG